MAAVTNGIATRFKPGQSGNPGGRPKAVAEVQALARQHTAEAIETLATIMRHKGAPAAARVSAANAIIDRGYGKPAQTVITDSEKRDATDWSRNELVAFLNRATERASPH